MDFFNSKVRDGHDSTNNSKLTAASLTVYLLQIKRLLSDLYTLLIKMTLSLEFWSRKFAHTALKLLCILNDAIIRFESNLNLCYSSKLEICIPCYQNHGFFSTGLMLF